MGGSVFLVIWCQIRISICFVWWIKVGANTVNTVRNDLLRQISQLLFLNIHYRLEKHNIITDSRVFIYLCCVIRRVRKILDQVDFTLIFHQALVKIAQLRNILSEYRTVYYPSDPPIHHLYTLQVSFSNTHHQDTLQTSTFHPAPRHPLYTNPSSRQCQYTPSRYPPDTVQTPFIDINDKAMYYLPGQTRQKSLT